MRRRRLPLGVLVPVGMVVLVCTLAVLQYRWLGQVSEAEAEQLRASLTHNAEGFAEEFDREISGVYLALQPANSDVIASGNALDLADRLARWRASSRFGDLVDAVYFSREGESLRRLDEDERELVESEWPASLEPVRTRLQPERIVPDDDDTVAGVFEFRLSPMMPDIPAIVVPLFAELPPGVQLETRTATTGNVRLFDRFEFGDAMTELRVHRDVLIVSLDAAYLRETMLPSLANLHFPEQSADRYRISIVDRDSSLVATRPSTAPVIPADEADIVVPFFDLRLNAMRAASITTAPHFMTWAVTRSDGTLRPSGRLEATPNDQAISVIVSEQASARTDLQAVAETAINAVRFSPAGWQIRVQHADGSLEAAVANARTRNLWLSFGMLALLMASVGLVVVNARRSERLAARQMDFVATVSHELRTPLAVIRSAAQNLQAGVVLDRDQTRRYGDLIEDEGRRLTDMVEQVLEYAGLSGQRHAARTQPVDVRSVAVDAIDGCQSLLDEQGFEVAMDVPADLPAVMADEDALRRALQNLVTNALKYATDGRWVGVGAERATSGGRTEVRISVTDHGRGIEADDLPHIFEPFYRGRDAQDRQIHGNGLGLSLVKRIAEAHGGRLTVKSLPGQGATFTLHLPVAPADPHEGLATAPAPEAGHQAT